MMKGQIKVAVVDDAPGYLRALERLLRAAGFAPLAYSSAEAFLFEHSRAPLDCAVIDIQLGTTTGFDIARRLAAENSRVPIIFITAHDNSETQEQARQLGCVAYLRKPFVAESLFAAIRQATLSDSAAGATILDDPGCDKTDSTESEDTAGHL